MSDRKRDGTKNPAGGNDRQKCSRRDFLERSGAVLAATSFATQSALAAYTPPKKVRIGVVGGGFGCAFLWHEHPDCIVQAVSDLRADRRERLMKRFSCDNVYNSLAELVLDKNVDAVAIFTDGPLHVEHVVECMKHGKHVISAVPACWGTLEQAELLLDTVKKYGLTYMMAETSYYRQPMISARKFYQGGKFGHLYYCEAEYQHDGVMHLAFDQNGKRTWRYGIAPMHYPTHCTAFLVGLTGERLTEVVCHGWGDDDPMLKDNVYKNPFWDESAMFRTDRGHAFRVNVWWKGAHRGCERAQWIGDVMGEPRTFGLLSGDPAFWNGVALYTQRAIIEDAKAKTLAAVGVDIAEANETKEKIELVKVTLTEADRKITVDRNGVIRAESPGKVQVRLAFGKLRLPPVTLAVRERDPPPGRLEATCFRTTATVRTAFDVPPGRFLLVYRRKEGTPPPEDPLRVTPFGSINDFGLEPDSFYGYSAALADEHGTVLTLRTEETQGRTLAGDAVRWTSAADLEVLAVVYGRGLDAEKKESFHTGFDLARTFFFRNSLEHHRQHNIF